MAGQLKIRQWVLTDLKIRHLDVPGKRGSTFKWALAGKVIYLVVNLTGEVSLQLSDRTEPLHFLSGTCNMFYCEKAEGSILMHDSFSEMLVLQFDRDYFLTLCQNPEILKLPFMAAVQKGEPSEFFKVACPTNSAVEKIASDITNRTVDEKFRTIQLSAKGQELLAHVFDLGEKAVPKKLKHCKTEYDRERLQFARTYLLQNAGNPPSLTELSRIAGINQLKLKEGFKELFGDTVFGFLNEYRLEKAQGEIGAGQKSMTQIAFELGYSSLQHFSTAYKKKFGKSPRTGKR